MIIDREDDRPKEGPADGCFMIENMIWWWRLESQVNQSFLRKVENKTSASVAGTFGVSRIPPATLRAERFVQGTYDWVRNQG